MKYSTKPKELPPNNGVYAIFFIADWRTIKLISPGSLRIGCAHAHTSKCLLVLYLQACLKPPIKVNSPGRPACFHTTNPKITQPRFKLCICNSGEQNLRFFRVFPGPDKKSSGLGPYDGSATIYKALRSIQMQLAYLTAKKEAKLYLRK